MGKMNKLGHMQQGSGWRATEFIRVNMIIDQVNLLTDRLDNLDESDHKIWESIAELQERLYIIEYPDSVVARNAAEAMKPETCSCGEPHVSDRIEHRYDGKPCYVKESSPQKPEIPEYINGYYNYSKQAFVNGEPVLPEPSPWKPECDHTLDGIPQTTMIADGKGNEVVFCEVCRKVLTRIHAPTKETE